MAFRQLAIAGFVIIAGFLFLQGLGTDFGIVSQINSFTDEFPTDPDTECDWIDRGTLFNLNTTTECQLQLEDLETVSQNIDVLRILIDTTSEWGNHYEELENFEIEAEEGGYITPSQTVSNVTIPEGVEVVKHQNAGTRFDTTTFTTSFTVDPGNDRMLLLTIGAGNPNAVINTASYDGQSMTQVARVNDPSETATFVYRLVNPPTGSNTLSFTFDGKYKGNYGAIQLNNVDQSNPIDDVKTTTGIGTVSEAVITEEGNLVLDAVSSKEAMTAGSGQTVIFDVELDNLKRHGSSYKTDDGSVPMSWSNDNVLMSYVVMDIQSATTEDTFSIYNTNRFFGSGDTPLELTYNYNFSSNPESATLQLYDTVNAEVVDTLNLSVAGSGENAEAFSLPGDGIYQFRIEYVSGSFGEQKFYSLEAVQDSSDIENISIGHYESDVVRSGSEVEVNSLRYVGRNILRHAMTNGELPHTAQIRLEGLRNGQLVVERVYAVENGAIKVNANPFPDTEINGYSFDIYLISESSERPLFESLNVEGTVFERVFSEEVSDLMRTLLFVIFVGMALAYVAFEIVWRR